ncbi:MipA/OmpV family protein [uncultured Sphingomonas sp.]|uniref:MipA/OmpV family protein n=1 Tax=unclassified Sphingomonas TaxID=196159 RepID=UPI0025DF1AE1|nr:MipA/OmpV family protein [uncultured Sphingomonas sp.]
MNPKSLIGFVALIAAVPTAVSAQSVSGPADTPTATEQPSGDMVTIGIGAGYLPDYDGSNDYRFVPVPAAIGTIGGINFSVTGNRASADLLPSRPGEAWDIQLGPVAVINFTRSSRQGIDDPRVRRLGELDTAVEVGGYFGIGKTGVITSPYDKLSLSLSYRHDVAGVHRSGIWQPTLNYFTPLSRKTAVALFASAERVESKYVRTYFNVSPEASVASGLPVYNGRGGWKSYTLGAVGTVSLTGDLLKGFKLVGGGTYRRMLDDVAASPLVSIAGSRNQWAGVLGIGYTF